LAVATHPSNQSGPVLFFLYFKNLIVSRLIDF
jgi:hypothetical protein